MPDEDTERCVLELYDQYPGDLKFIAQNCNTTEENVREILSRASRIENEPRPHTQIRPAERIESIRKGRPHGALWRLNLNNFLRENFASPFISAYMSYESGYLPLLEFEKMKNSLLFNYKSVMKAIRLNFDNKSDYGKIIGYFMEQRKKFEEIIDYLVDNGTFDNWQRDGLSPEEMFALVVVEMMHKGFYPFYADLNDDNKLKPLEMEDYLSLIRGRAIKISKEVETKSRTIEKIDHYVPLLDRLVKTELKDSTIFDLPIVCPICNTTFTTAEAFKNHLESEHRPTS